MKKNLLIAALIFISSFAFAQSGSLSVATKHLSVTPKINTSRHQSTERNISWVTEN